MYSKIVVYIFKMSFNNLKDFNKKFMLFECFYRGVEELIATVNNNTCAGKTIDAA